jgi:glutaminyl-peptide cyclotransferase
MRIEVAVILALLVISPALSVAGGEEGQDTPAGCQLSFDGELANESVQFQTSLGPRLPGSAASSALRESIKSNLTGWTITETTHHVDGMVLTNLFATWNPGAGSEVYFAAHYDTRKNADQDWNQSRQDEPILGANDGASGVAVLVELARQIPAMNLSHEVTLFFTDGEDQGDTFDTMLLGAKAWADNLTTEEIDSIESFILVDMVGDSDLTLRKTSPGNSELWNRTTDTILFLDEVCEYGDTSYFDFEGYDPIYDDHDPAYKLGIPAIDIIDTRYGENSTYLGGHWHTHNDTADKISSESLQKVGRILESGLLTGSWLDVRLVEVVEESKPEPLDNNQSNEEDDTEQESDDMAIGVLLIGCILLVWGNLAWLLFADKRGEG